jgi:single-stranded-DNA-specific exonuclease
LEDNFNLDKKEIKKAFIRLNQALKNKESIIVYTDYDADGICAGAILWETLFSLGAKVMPYVPHRIDEGYGLSIKGINNCIKKFNPSLIITVDHGISAVEASKYAKQKIIHTVSLVAGGLTFIFCKKFLDYLNIKKYNQKAGKIILDDKLELAAIATIADLIPLLGSNRILAALGIKELNKTKRLGLKALIADSGLKEGEIGSFEISHVLSPRINAAGRMTHAITALRLLCTTDAGRAMELSRQLNLTNKERQELTKYSTQHAMESVRIFQSQALIRNNRKDKIIVVAHDSYTQGIIGLIAGKLVEEYYRPAIAIAKEKELSKGSARSIAGFDIVENLRKLKHILKDIGGHPMAAGFTIMTCNIPLLVREINKLAEQYLSEDLLIREIKIDVKLCLSEITPKLYKDIQKFAPFGKGNPEPVFSTEGVNVEGISKVGKEGQHLKLLVSQGKGNGKIIYPCIGFSLGNLYTKIIDAKIVDIAYTINEDSWNKTVNSLQLKLKDVRLQD